MSKIRHTRGVYLNEGYKDNGVSAQNLKLHIEYNTTMRPGRALFVDGKCIHKGYLTDADVKAIEDNLAINPVVMERDTQPYQ